jgi:hypothetical protein
LLYLVPCTLGVVCLVAWKRGDLSELWTGYQPERARIEEDDAEEYLTDDHHNM